MLAHSLSLRLPLHGVGMDALQVPPFPVLKACDSSEAILPSGASLSGVTMWPREQMSSQKYSRLPLLTHPEGQDKDLAYAGIPFLCQSCHLLSISWLWHQLVSSGMTVPSVDFLPYFWAPVLQLDCSWDSHSWLLLGIPEDLWKRQMLNSPRPLNQHFQGWGPST